MSEGLDPAASARLATERIKSTALKHQAGELSGDAFIKEAKAAIYAGRRAQSLLARKHRSDAEKLKRLERELRVFGEFIESKLE